MANTVVKLNVHNTFKECTEMDADRFQKAIVQPVVETLIDKLSRKNPSWEFYAVGYGSTTSAGVHYFSRFKIKDFGEELGWIDYETHWRDADKNTYTFDGPRLEAKRSRGSASKARNVDKAAKLICANISSMTLAERMLKARHRAHEAIGTLSSRASYRYRQTRETLSDTFATFALARWEEFEAHIVGTMPTVQSAASILLDDYTNMQVAIRISAMRISDKGATVHINKDDYHVTYDDAPDVIHTFKPDTVPTGIKTSIALLKLVETGKHIDNVGIRVDDGLFYAIKGDA
jgi:hypothetical protein